MTRLLLTFAANVSRQSRLLQISEYLHTVPTHVQGTGKLFFAGVMCNPLAP